MWASARAKLPEWYIVVIGICLIAGVFFLASHQPSLQPRGWSLRKIASAHLCFIRQVILRKPFGMTQPTKIGGEHLPQIHARSEAIPSKYAPRYIEQNDLTGLSYSMARTTLRVHPRDRTASLWRPQVLNERALDVSMSPSGNQRT